jgi:hypothetical protein
MSMLRLTAVMAAALTTGALIGVGPAAAKGAGGVAANGATPSSTVTGPPGTEASALRYAAIPSRGRTSINAIETDGGVIREQRALDGIWALPAVTVDGDPGGLSADGRTLVLMKPTYRVGGDSTFQVLDARSLRPGDRVTFDARFVFDAISPDGRLIYLVEYPDPGNFVEYRVRAYDVDTGELRPGAVVDPDEAGEPMTGEPYARAMSPDGRWAYTLYGGEETFVHALDTREATAVCIDLPQFEKADLFRFDLAVDPAGGAITVLDRGNPAAVIDPETFEVGAASDPGAATASGGGPDWVVWTLIGGGLVLCIGVFAIQRRWRRSAALEAGLEEALREDAEEPDHEERRPREPVA